MILLFEVECANGHANGGRLAEFPGDEMPTSEWILDAGQKLIACISENAKCSQCGDVRQAKTWRLRVIAGVPPELTRLAALGHEITFGPPRRMRDGCFHSPVTIDGEPHGHLELLKELVK